MQVGRHPAEVDAPAGPNLDWNSAGPRRKGRAGQEDDRDSEPR